MTWFAGSRNDKQSRGRERSGKETLGDLAVEAGGVVAIAVLLLGLVTETTAVRVLVFGTTGTSLALVAVTLWRHWRPGVKGWIALGVVLACLAVAAVAYFTEIH